MKSFELDHFLVAHTLDQAPLVSEELNKRPYDVVYFELFTDPDNQQRHQSALNRIIKDGLRIADLPLTTQSDPGSFHFYVACGMESTSTEAIVVDQDFGLRPDKSAVSTFEDAFMLRVGNAAHSRLREPRMAEQVIEDIEKNNRVNQIGAIVTGALHDGMDDFLLQDGIAVNAQRVGVVSDWRLSRNPNWDDFNGLSHEFINAIEYALRHGADVKQTQKAFNEVIARGRN
jgi:hypothetical protein